VAQRILHLHGRENLTVGQIALRLQCSRTRVRNVLQTFDAQTHPGMSSGHSGSAVPPPWSLQAPDPRWRRPDGS
jgi:hypothetical protein